MIFGKLLPREGNFFELFNQHANHIVAAANAFAELVKNYSDPALREKYNQQVDDAEGAADSVTIEVNRLLHKTFRKDAVAWASKHVRGRPYFTDELTIEPAALEKLDAPGAREAALALAAERGYLGAGA